jgi:phosphoglycolate phosphatase
VERLLPGASFRIVQGVSEHCPPKPDPAGAIGLARRLGVAPEEFLYLGDTNTDMATATKAGMYAVGATWGFRPAEELSAAGARTLIDRPLDLLDLL